MTSVFTNSENDERFFARLEGKLTRDELMLLYHAYVMAMHGHINQKRDGGKPYFYHCKETAIILMDELDIYDPEMIMAALLHDMLEDSTLISPQQIKIIFGPRVMGLVVTLTKPKKICQHFASDADRHKFYFIKIKNASLDAKIIKLCDRLHNLRTLDECAEEKRSRKIKETKDIYLPLIDDVAKTKPEVAEFFNREFAKCFEALELATKESQQ